MTELEELYLQAKEGISCNCNKIHKHCIEKLATGKGVIEQLISFFRKDCVSKDEILIIADRNTYEAGFEVINLLSNSNNCCLLLDESNGKIVPNEDTVQYAYDSLADKTKCLVALGSGTINDITRYVAYKADLPYISIPTAPSMDGYTSIHSPLIINGFKETMPAKAPKAVFADTNILMSAPDRMISAGIGDMIGKLTARADWYLSHLITDEYICTWIINTIYKSVYEITKLNLQKDSSLDLDNTLISGLLISGMGMLFVGNSRPASCSEHHLAHYWEMKGLMGSIPADLHGIHVGVGSIVISHFYKLLLDLDLNDINFNSKKTWDEKRDFLKHAYGCNWKEPVKIGHKRYKEVSILKKRQHKIQSNWKELKMVISSLAPNPDHLISILNKNGAPTNPRDIGITKGLFKESLLSAKELRDRYSVLQFAEDMGVLERVAEEVTDTLY